VMTKGRWFVPIAIGTDILHEKTGCTLLI